MSTIGGDKGRKPQLSGEVDSDRRRLPRHPGDTFQAAILAFEKGVVPVEVRDISVQGIGLLVDVPVEPGAWVTLGSRTHPHLGVAAQVKHQRPCEGKSLLGCLFARLLCVEDVMALS